MLTIAKSALRSQVPLRIGFSALGASRLQHTLPPLPYAYDALEPYISKEIMTLHHTKHHQTYVTGLNAAEEAYSKLDSTTTASAKQKIALQSALKFNGGGHINHSLFWTNLAPSAAVGNSSQHSGGVLTEGGELDKLIKRDFGSHEAFKKKFNTTTAAIQGSGWGWLGYDKEAGRLEIVTTANQDPLISHIPILGIDIWEHAFYLQYKNVKPDYLNAIWNVINFQEAEKRLKEAL